MYLSPFDVVLTDTDVVQPDFERVQCYPEGQRLTSPLLAGLSLDTNEIFAD